MGTHASADGRGLRRWATARPLRTATALLLGVALVAVLAGTAAGSASKLKPSDLTATPLTPSSQYQDVKSITTRIAQTDPTLLGATSSKPVNVMIKYDFDSTASYQGGVAGLAATSPRVTGKSLRDNPGAVHAYDSYINGRSAQISSALRNAVPGAKIRDSFGTVYGGVVAQVPANAVQQILSVPGVVAVQRDAVQQPDSVPTGAEPQFIGAPAVWASLGGQATAGNGVIVGDIDTGIWPEHPELVSNGLPAPARTYPCQFGDGTDPALGAPFTCNNKLIGAYAFTDTYMAVVGAGADEFCDPGTGVCSARDSEGHGTHTATTAVGDPVASAPLFGVERGPVSGIAPGAKLIVYRVCLSAGCFDSDTVSAVQQAILDGVNVINFSVSGGNSPYTDPVELAFLDAFNAGISVNASAGNDGPTAGTVAHNSPWVTTVGATTSNRFFTSTLHLTASSGHTLDKAGVTIMPGITTPTAVVLSSSYGDPLCQNPAPPGVAGDIVACQRGVNARVDKGFNVLEGGAAGMILYNPVKEDVETDNHWLPAIHVDGPNSDLVTFISTEPNVKATWVSGTATPTQGDVMAAFSSRGPAPDFIKPDITAPGIQVLAGMTAQPTGITNGPAGQLYQAIAGTSMSAPHATGASALIKAAHPTWTPAEIKSALMTSALQDVVKEDGTSAPTPFDEGSGALRVDRAANPTLVFNESYADYVASASDPLGRINLNIPSIDAPVMPGTVFTTRTGINVSNRDQDLAVSVSAPAGATIDVRGGRTLHVRRGGTLRLDITISAPSLPNGQYFGRITLTPKQSGYNAVTIPVAFFKQQGTVSLLNSCAPTTFRRITGHTHCTVSAQNFDASPANVKLVVDGIGNGNALLYSHIIAPPGTLKTPFGFLWKGTLTAASAPSITAISDVTGTTPIGGYIPLSIFVPAQPGFGDETITNFNVPAFRYGTESYSQIGVDSNGYVVVGGGDASDNNCCTLPPFPDPSRPNNVLAPFATDLDASHAAPGGGVYVATLSDGTTTWIVVDWEDVPTFGTTDYQEFEVWIQTAATPGEGITYEYGNVADGGASTGLQVGAENRDGSSGVNLGSLPIAGNEYGITTTGPTPGGSVSIDYDASSLRDGIFSSIANLTSNLTPGVTQQVQTLTVTK